MPRIVSDEDARGGERGRPTLIALVSALVLVGVVFVGYMMWSGSRSPDSAAQNASRAETTGSVTGQGSGPSSSNTSSVPTANPAYPAPAVPSANSNARSAGPTSDGK
jgi:flagellar basal body-associated protein FliL